MTKSAHRQNIFYSLSMLELWQLKKENLYLRSFLLFLMFGFHLRMDKFLKNVSLCKFSSADRSTDKPLICCVHSVYL